MTPHSPPPPSPSLTILFSFIATVCLLLHLLHRRLYPKLHLKPPPGPTPIPIIGNLHLLGHLPHRSLQSLAQKYGPIMSLRLGSISGIIVSSSEAAELFLKTYDHVFASRPKLQISEILSYNNKSMVLSPYGSYWRNMRKMCTLHLLSPSKIESFLPERREQLRNLVAEIRVSAAEQEVVDLSEKVAVLTGDLACKMVLGCSIKERYDLKGMIHEIMSLLGAFNLADFVPLLRPFNLQGFTQRLKSLSPIVDKLLEEILNEHEQNINSDNKSDFVDTLLSMLNKQSMNSSNNKLEYTIDRDNIKALLLDMISASYDTSATVIGWAFSEIVKNPHILHRLQEELEITIGMNKMVEEADIPKLSYLDMVVKETFRLHPPGPLLIPRESIEDVMINGYHIVKNSRIIVNVWAIGRDPNIWSNNVEEFLPERFINSNIDVKGLDFMLTPFGSGRRTCPGMRLGLINVKLVLAQLMHCFNWEFPSGMSAKDLDMTEEFGLSTPRAKPLLLVPTYRLHV